MDGWHARLQKTAFGGQDDSSVIKARQPLVSSSAFGDQDGLRYFLLGARMVLRQLRLGSLRFLLFF